MDNSQFELIDFVNYWKSLNERVNEIYKNNPPVFLRRALRFKDWPSFDGDSMAPEWVNVYDYPADDILNAFLNKEHRKSERDPFGDCHCKLGCTERTKGNHWPIYSKKNPCK